MAELQVQKSEKGWIFTKTVDGKQSQIELEDTNKNGKPDDNTVSILSTDAGTITAAEYKAAKNSIFTSAGSTCTEEEWLNATKENEKEAAAAEKFNEQQRQQQLQQALRRGNGSSKKKSLMQRITGGLMIGLGAFNAAMPFIFKPWQYNGNNLFDIQGMLFSSLTGIMTSMAGIAMMQGGNANQFATMPYNTAGGMDFNSIMSMQNEYMAQREAQYNELLNQIQESATEQRKKNEESRKKAEKEKQAKMIKDVFTKINNSETPVSDTNKAYINSIYEVDKEEYTEEEIANVKLITQYPTIPYEAISKTGEKGKLTEKLAEEIDTAIQQYEEFGDKENKLDESSYKLIKETLLPKAKEGKLTDEDIASIRNILKEYAIKQAREKEEK